MKKTPFVLIIIALATLFALRVDKWNSDFKKHNRETQITNWAQEFRKKTVANEAVSLLKETSEQITEKLAEYGIKFEPEDHDTPNFYRTRLDDYQESTWQVLQDMKRTYTDMCRYGYKIKVLRNGNIPTYWTAEVRQLIQRPLLSIEEKDVIAEVAVVFDAFEKKWKSATTLQFASLTTDEVKWRGQIYDTENDKK